MAEKLLFVHSVARRLGCSKRHVYNLIQRGELNAVRIGFRALRVPESSLVTFLDRRRFDANDERDQLIVMTAIEGDEN